MPYNMVNFGQLTAEICSLVWGTPADFHGFRVLSSLLQRRLSTEATKLCTMFGRLLGCYTIIHFSGLLPRDGILPGAKFTLRPSLAFFYTGSVTARPSSNGRQPNFVALSRGRQVYSAGRPSRWVLAHILLVYVSMCAYRMHTVFQKTPPPYCHHSFVDPIVILIIFSADVTVKVDIQKIFYFPTSPN